jgi:flagellar hook assembly protein FlgD
VQTSDGVTFEINPNPLHGKAMMKYSIPEDGLVNIQILRIDGRLIKILSNEAKQAGEGVIGFDSEGFKPGSYLVKFYYKGRIEKTIIRKLFIY